MCWNYSCRNIPSLCLEIRREAVYLARVDIISAVCSAELLQATVQVSSVITSPVLAITTRR